MALAHTATTQLKHLFSGLPRPVRLFVLTGAGCSTPSGIPDYRDTDGNWKRSPPMHLPEFLSSEHARQRYWARSMAGWRSFHAAQPNGVHVSIARLEASGHCKTLVTQNVDGLHQRAGSQEVIDLHGRLDQVLCLDCGHRMAREQVQEALVEYNPDWHYAVSQIAPDGDVDLEQVDYAHFKVPGCTRCRGRLKPDVVFFGENVPKLRVERALKALEAAHALLVVGSSLMVYSGFRYARAAAAAAQPVIIINRGQTRADDLANLKLNMDASDALDALHEALTQA
jgi:NAD-dependent SIR2 family protein deacetylase